MRKYQPVWDRIKARQKVVLEVEPFLVARVKKAVIKEKWLDLGFKLLNEHDRLYLDIIYIKEKKHLVFQLKQALGLEPIVKED